VFWHNLIFQEISTRNVTGDYANLMTEILSLKKMLIFIDSGVSQKHFTVSSF